MEEAIFPPAVFAKEALKSLLFFRGSSPLPVAAGVGREFMSNRFLGGEALNDSGDGLLYHFIIFVKGGQEDRNRVLVSAKRRPRKGGRI